MGMPAPAETLCPGWVWMVAEGSEEQALPFSSTASCYRSYHVIFLPCNFSLRCRIQHPESCSRSERAELLRCSVWLLLGLAPHSATVWQAECLFKAASNTSSGWSTEGESWLLEKLWHGTKPGLHKRTLSCLQTEPVVAEIHWRSISKMSNTNVFVHRQGSAQNKWKIFCFHWSCNSPTDSDKLLTEWSLSRSGNVCVSPGTARCVPSRSYQPLLWGYNRFITPHFCTNTLHSSRVWEKPRMGFLSQPKTLVGVLHYRSQSNT